jgi:hypothetical protein
MRVRLKFDNSFINKLSTGLLKNNIGDSISGNVSMAPQNNALRMGTVSYPEELMETKDADYLIIASEPFYGSAKLKQLAEWRASYSGLNVIVAPTDKIYYRFGSINTPETSIRDFVRYAYNFWKSSNSNDGKLRYVLIVGDSEYIPVKISNRMSFDEYIATDNWYACVSGDDLFPDVMIGRLPSKSLTELSIMIDKIIQYEQNPLYGEWAIMLF